MPTNKARIWLFLLGALEGVAAAATLFSIPSEGGTLSPARLLLIAIPLMGSILWIFLGVRHAGQMDRFARPGFIVLLALLALTLGVSLFLLRYLDPARQLSNYERLGPVLWYFLAICVQTAFYLLYVYGGIHTQGLSNRRAVFSAALVVFVLLLAALIFISVTRLGLTFDPAYWGEPGVPILGWQFLLALIGGLFILCVGIYARSRALDLALPIGLYGLMLALCLSVPTSILKNSFYMPMSWPDLEPFPYSDSAYYDQMAQSLLIGHPYQSVIPTRPMYILFLTILHLVFGQNYEHIIIAQTFVLALIPVFLYFLGKKLHSRTAGVMIAMFFIFREWTSLWISSETRVTNTKMLLVDLPTLLLLLLTCLFVWRWFERRGWLEAFLAGGVFGVLLLLRTQAMLLVPFILLVALLVLGWRNRSLVRDIAFFVSGLVVSILPWLVHNYQLTGKFAFDADFQNQLVVNLYVFQGNSAIQNLNTEGMGLGRILVEFALRDPAHVFGFIANHFLAAQVNGMLALPLIEPYHGIRAPINLYWMKWDGQLAWYNVLLLIVYLAVISLGIGAAWKRWRWIGLLPLVFSLAYALSTAIGRFSSWRYDYPADWVYYFYFGIGFAELLSQGAVLFGAPRERVFPSSFEVAPVPGAPHPARGAALALLFLLIGASPWMIKTIASPRYPDQSAERLRAKMMIIAGAPASEEIESFASQPEAFLQIGRLLYPRYFNRDGGLRSANPSPAYAPYDYPRLGFMLLNDSSTAVIFPTRSLPGPIPHAADVIVLGCQRERFVEARLIAFPEMDLAYRSAPLDEPCSK